MKYSNGSDKEKPDWSSVKSNLAKHQVKEKKFLAALQTEDPSWDVMEHIPVASKKDGRKGDFVLHAPTKEIYCELKVDSWAHRNKAQTLFVEVGCSDLYGNGVKASGLTISQADSFIYIFNPSPLDPNTTSRMYFIRREDLLTLICNNDFPIKKTAQGANGNLYKFTTFGRIIPMQKLVEISRQDFECPPDFWTLWSSWGEK